jgi:hypothetical protein
LKKGLLLFLSLSSLLSQAQLLPNFGGQRAGLSVLSFLKNDLSPISFAMASASIANKGNLYSSENNPAALVQISSSGIALSNLSVGAGIHQSFLASGYKLDDGSVIGFNVNSLNAGSYGS